MTPILEDESMLTKSTRCTVIFGTLSLVVYACQLLFFFTYYATELPVLNDSDHTAEPVTPSHPPLAVPLQQDVAEHIYL